MANISKIYDKAAEKEYMLADLGARNGTAIQNGAITPEKTSFGHILHKTSDNIYNPDLQTEETISPHYYVSGKPYETTQFDNSYHCTAPIAVEEDTAYWLGLVPAMNGYTKPWADAGHGVFFYDADGNFISGTTANSFTTPKGTASLRFNYAMYNNLTLYNINASCMLIKGMTAPTVYERYYDYYLDHQMQALTAHVDTMTKAVYYHLENDVLDIIYKYSDTKDMRVRLCKKGGNSLFDFYQFALIDNDTALVSADHNGGTIFITTPSDWFAPFTMAAKTNIDGDLPDSGHFTGGNHEYTNTGTGGTPTARTAEIKLFADGRMMTYGEGYAEKIEICWTNYVQAYNTKKADGTGREVLLEKHRMFFDGERFRCEIELVPLEDVTVLRWYGLQCPTSHIWRGQAHYVGGVNRAYFDVATATSSGDKTATALILENEGNVLEMGIDPTVDIGDRRFYTGTEGIFTRTYNKAYMNIIAGADLLANCVYTLKGYYRFHFA